MNWHTRYLQQARWTENLRSYLFNKVGIAAAGRVLDLGCGTGALLGGLPVKAGAAVHGADLSLPAVIEASVHAPGARLLCADGASLPYADSTFDVVFCHFVLLWVREPLPVLEEMRRVTRAGGAVLALAEPDYGGRIDYPPPLEQLGRWQADSLRGQGADPIMGRKLAGLFARAGLRQVETGVLGGEWRASIPGERELEWDVLQADLAGKIPAQDIQKMKILDDEAWETGERVLFVPTFFAWGRV
jgi:SAM-dependent methyltransferase